MSIPGVVATRSREAFGVDATQTPAGLSGGPFSGEDPSEEYSSVDFCIEQIQDLQGRLAKMGVSYWVGDGFYAKQKVFGAITEMDGDLITWLRSDANLR